MNLKRNLMNQMRTSQNNLSASVRNPNPWTPMNLNSRRVTPTRVWVPFRNPMDQHYLVPSMCSRNVRCHGRWTVIKCLVTHRIISHINPVPAVVGNYLQCQSWWKLRMRSTLMIVSWWPNNGVRNSRLVRCLHFDFPHNNNKLIYRQSHQWVIWYQKMINNHS